MRTLQLLLGEHHVQGCNPRVCTCAAHVCVYCAQLCTCCMSAYVLHVCASCICACAVHVSASAICQCVLCMCVFTACMHVLCTSPCVLHVSLRVLSACMLHVCTCYMSVCAMHVCYARVLHICACAVHVSACPGGQTHAHTLLFHIFPDITLLPRIVECSTFIISESHFAFYFLNKNVLALQRGHVCTECTASRAVTCAWDHGAWGAKQRGPGAHVAGGARGQIP